jgi:hypothetical protein
MADAAVTAACISALAALAAGVVAWLAQRSSARLRAELDGRDSRLRNDLARDLAGHESALRVAGELELRLMSQASESITATVRLLTDACQAFLEFSMAARNGRDGNATRTLEMQTALQHSGMFIPPELDDAYGKAAAAIMNGMAAVIPFQVLGGKEGAQRLEKMEKTARELVFEFRKQSGEWKRAA